MVCNTRNNDSQSSPSNPSVANATLEVTSQKNPQLTPTVGVSCKEDLGAMMLAHVSSTIPAAHQPLLQPHNHKLVLEANHIQIHGSFIETNHMACRHLLCQAYILIHSLF